VQALETLAEALRAERSALIQNDVAALGAANATKLAALRQLEQAELGDVERARVVELAELNRANGALLARRQREVRWALRQLGRGETVPAYGADGQIGMRARQRALGIG